MDIFEHFACYTRLPVRLDDIREHILDEGLVQTIRFYSVDLDPAVLPGFVRVSRWRPIYGDMGLHAEIFYSSALDENWRRLVVCKEMLHLRDKAAELAQSRADVIDLIRGIRVPLSIAMNLPTFSDHVGLIRALRLLIPRDALLVLREHSESGRITSEVVAKLARVPDIYTEFMLTSEWLIKDVSGS